MMPSATHFAPTLTRSLRLGFIVLLGLALGACAFPRKDYASVPGPEVITVTRHGTVYKAAPPDCDKLLQPSQYNKTDDLRMSVAFGCATYTNLAEQIANPADLVQPRPYGGQPADTATSAVERYRAGEVTPLRETRSTDAGAN